MVNPRGGRLGAALVLLLVCLAGCGREIPFEVIRAREPEERWLRIDDQWVHIERTGAGEPVVFLHGFGGSTYSWRFVLPALADAFDVLAIDLSGFGYTERPEGLSAYAPDGQLRLIERTLDQLGIDAVHIVGHSYGAALAARWALRHPQRTRSVVLVDGGGIGGEGGGPLIPAFVRPFVTCYVRYFLLNERNIRLILRGAVFDPAVVDTPMVRAYLERLRVEGLDRAIAGFSQAGTSTVTSGTYEDIRRPVLILWGRQDGVFPVAQAEALAERLPNATLVILDRCGHLPMEERPAAFLDALRGFLTSLPPTDQ